MVKVSKTRHDGTTGMAALFGSISVLFFLVLRTMPGVLSFLPACVFHEATGIPCPTCGMGRAALNFSNGDLTAAFLWNPLGTLLMAGALLLPVYSAYRMLMPRARAAVAPDSRRGERAAAAFLAFAGLNWLYLVLILPR